MKLAALFLHDHSVECHKAPSGRLRFSEADDRPPSVTVRRPETLIRGNAHLADARSRIPFARALGQEQKAAAQLKKVVRVMQKVQAAGQVPLHGPKRLAIFQFHVSMQETRFSWRQ